MFETGEFEQQKSTVMDHRVLTRILKTGVKRMFTRKVWSFTKLLHLELLKKLGVRMLNFIRVFTVC